MLTSLLLSHALAAPRVTVRVMPATREAPPGAPVDVAVVVRVPKGWHIFWENPGPRGLATDVRLDASANVLGPSWPVPAFFKDEGFTDYGYTGTIGFVFTVTADAVGEVPLAASVEWLLCKRVCIPGSATANATIAIQDGVPPPEPTPYRAKLPRPFAETGGHARIRDGRLLVSLPRPLSLFPSTALDAVWQPSWTFPDCTRVLFETPVPGGPAYLVMVDADGRGWRLDLPPPPEVQ